ncbi:hypothetical protein NDU88_006861 [Pleurodeles waltl]|uniref:Uncharacterized protein n=1 Tax=Pleurodeles waltl TaxID=8319 RepID=A0AAV7VRU4_PLEWA|nr:hypothetical protein NDU88_006861 [Pleurodeles waltl]
MEIRPRSEDISLATCASWLPVISFQGEGPVRALPWLRQKRPSWRVSLLVPLGCLVTPFRVKGLLEPTPG